MRAAVPSDLAILTSTYCAYSRVGSPLRPGFFVPGTTASVSPAGRLRQLVREAFDGVSEDLVAGHVLQFFDDLLEGRLVDVLAQHLADLVEGVLRGVHARLVMRL